MMKLGFHYAIVLLSLVVLDGLWLGVISKNFYARNIGGLFRADFFWPAIALFYFLYAAAIVYFAVLPADGAWIKALVAGILLGGTAYMTYDLVNYATLKDWPPSVVLVDIMWGSAVTGSAATIATILGRV